MCDRDAKGAPSMLRLIRSAAALARMLPTLHLRRRTPSGGSGTGHGHVAQAELLKLPKSGQFPDELVKIQGAQIHYVASPDVLAIAGIKEIALGGLLL